MHPERPEKWSPPDAGPPRFDDEDTGRTVLWSEEKTDVGSVIDLCAEDISELEELEPSYPSTSEILDHHLVGKVIASRYEVQSMVGKGAHSWVLKAHDRVTLRAVAVKLLRDELVESRGGEFQERFLRESKLCREVQHPHVVRVFDYGVLEDGTCYIAMELLAGVNLKHLLRNEGPFDVLRAIRLFEQVGDALSAAHQLGFIHRDIKPSNVFMMDTGRSADFIKLLDFGLVKSADGANQQAELTDDGSFVGTPQYAAPEQLRSQPCDARTDIYAMGVLMYRVLTGTLPFRGQTWVDIAVQHLESPVPLMAERNPDVVVPPELEAIVRRCLEKEPAHRYRSMSELIGALDVVRRDIELRQGLEDTGELPSFGTMDGVLDPDSLGALDHGADAAQDDATNVWLVALQILAIAVAVGALGAAFIVVLAGFVL